MRPVVVGHEAWEWAWDLATEAVVVAEEEVATEVVVDPA